MFVNVSQINAYYNAPKNTTSIYQVIQCNEEVYDYFKYLEINDNITVHIIDSNNGSVSTEITSNRRFYHQEDDIANGWTDSTCFPFIIDLTYLNKSLDQNVFYVESSQIKTIFGVEREIITIKQEKIIGDNKAVYYYYQYDNNTGILIDWLIKFRNDDYVFIQISMIYTDAWLEEVEGFKWWVLLLFIGIPLLIIISAIIVYYFKYYKKKQ